MAIVGNTGKVSLNGAPDGTDIQINGDEGGGPYLVEYDDSADDGTLVTTDQS